MSLTKVISLLMQRQNLHSLMKHFCVKTPLSLDTSTPPKKPKTIPIPRITLVTGDQVTVSTVEDAQKIAKRRDLKLVKMLDIDTKTQRPIYKLMSASEYHAEDLKQREEKKREKQNTLKGEKVLLINSKISSHDLQIHLSKMTKWLTKGYQTRVVINGDANNMEQAENIYITIDNHLKKENDSKILQKRQKGNDIKFQVSPNLKKTNNSGPNVS